MGKGDRDEEVLDLIREEAIGWDEILGDGRKESLKEREKRGEWIKRKGMVDRSRVLNGKPWFIGNQILSLKPWMEVLDDNTGAFLISPMRIEIWKLPIH
ncbi:hypothetical protein ACH5RR_032436 [Cinchona calisaya]|uniref:Uncharacterized protein n=1 Tax=Cinchona calisaya TaxID=153742 RepID=A0ABD2YM72_9GENT